VANRGRADPASKVRATMTKAKSQPKAAKRKSKPAKSKLEARPAAKAKRRAKACAYCGAAHRRKVPTCSPDCNRLLLARRREDAATTGRAAKRRAKAVTSNRKGKAMSQDRANASLAVRGLVIYWEPESGFWKVHFVHGGVALVDPYTGDAARFGSIGAAYFAALRALKG